MMITMATGITTIIGLVVDSQVMHLRVHARAFVIGRRSRRPHQFTSIPRGAHQSRNPAQRAPLVPRPEDKFPRYVPHLKGESVIANVVHVHQPPHGYSMQHLQSLRDRSGGSGGGFVDDRPALYQQLGLLLALD
jgi:hypothetical protein